MYHKITIRIPHRVAMFWIGFALQSVGDCIDFIRERSDIISTSQICTPRQRSSPSFISHASFLRTYSTTTINVKAYIEVVYSLASDCKADVIMADVVTPARRTKAVCFHCSYPYIRKNRSKRTCSACVVSFTIDCCYCYCVVILLGIVSAGVAVFITTHEDRKQ